MHDVYLRIEPRLFGLVNRVFDTVAADPDLPIDEGIIEDAHEALQDANNNAVPGLPIVINVIQSTLDAISCCFEVGGEGAADISDDEYEASHALLTVNRQDPSSECRSRG